MVRAMIRIFRGKGVTAGLNGVEVGADFTPAEIEFMLAMDAFKLRTHTANPDCRDVLAVAKALGYRLVAKAVPIPHRLA